MPKYIRRCGNTGRNRSYMRALRDLLQVSQHDIIELSRVQRLNNDAQVSTIDAKLGYDDLWNAYADIYENLILESDHGDVIKVIMKTLLSEWKGA